MTFEGALIREQGVSFGVVIVKRSVLDAPQDAASTISSFSPLMGGVPVVLMAQDSNGVPTYYGRRDLVAFLANVPLAAIPWKRYSFN